MPRLNARDHYLANIRLTERLIRLEQVVGSLLTLLAAQNIIGPEDFGRVREALSSRTPQGGPPHEEHHQRRPQAARRPPA